MKKAIVILPALALVLLACAALGKKEAAPPTSAGRTVETVQFGTYEQDGDLNDGPEPIEWIVLEERDDEMTLLSLRCLDAQIFDEDWSAMWNNSGLRSWLNGEFLQAAFPDAADRELLVEAKRQTSGETLAGSVPDIRDRVAVLSQEEAEAYFSGDAERQAQPTAYAASRGVWARDRGAFEGGCLYWLRNPGGNDGMVAGVDYTGAVDTGHGFGHASAIVGVRPTITVRTSPAIDASRGKAALPAAVQEDAGIAGAIVKFGAYPQGGLGTIAEKYGLEPDEGDAGQEGGAAARSETVEWIVLDEKDGELLLISRYCLDARPYGGATWEASRLRAWLNGEFIDRAFTTDEQALLAEATLENPGSSATTDRAWLLSAEELMRYLPLERQRTTCATACAALQGADLSDVTEWSSWWLRTPGQAADTALYVSFSGDLASEGAQTYAEADAGEFEYIPAVRPVIAVRATLDELEALAAQRG